MQSLKRKLEYKDGVAQICGLGNIGWVYNEGPPHDHNRIWRDSRYLEDLHPSWVDKIIDGDVWVVYENGEPLMYDGKIIIDLYKILL
jgi:hypothetical protein